MANLADGRENAKPLLETLSYVYCHSRGFREMISAQQRRVWTVVAVVAVLAVILLQVVPHAGPGGAGAWLAVLPILLFVGMISPLSLLSPMAYMYLGHVAAAPLLPASFQRPPPIRLG